MAEPELAQPGTLIFENPDKYKLANDRMSEAGDAIV